MLKTDYKFGEVFPLASQVKKNESKVEFQDIMNNNNGGVALLAFSAGQDLASHLAPAEVMVQVLEGEVIFTMIDRPLHLMPANSSLWATACPIRYTPLPMPK